MKAIARRLVTIRVTVVFIFITGILITSMSAVILQYLFSSKIATQAATSNAANIANNTIEKVATLSQKAEHSVELLARNSALVSGNHVGPVVDELFANLLDNNNEFYAVYIGLKNGDFYELINLEASPAIRRQLGAALTDRYAKIIIKDIDGKRMKQTLFLTEQFTISNKTEQETEYDASSRNWFRIANDIKASKTAPYLFHILQAPGQTYSMRIEGSEAVIAIDIALSTMSEFLTKQISNITGMENGEAYLYNADGTLIASNTEVTATEEYQFAPVFLSKQELAYIDSLNVIRVSNEMDWAPFDYSISGQPRGYAVEFTSLLAESLGLSIEYVNGVSWSKLTDYFQQQHIEVLMPVYATESNKHWGLFSDPILDLPMTLATRDNGRRYSSLSELDNKVLAIPAGWSIIPAIEAVYPDIKILQVKSISDAIKAVIDGRAEATIESKVILEYNRDIYYLDGIHIQPELDITPVQFDSNLRYVLPEKLAPLKDLFNRALASVSEKDRFYLADKWLKRSPGVVSQPSRAVPYQALIEKVADESNYGQLTPTELKSGEHLIYLSPIFNETGQFIAIVLNADDILSTSRKEVLISAVVTVLVILLLLPASWLMANPIVLPIKQLARENIKVMHRKFHLVNYRSSVIKEVDELARSLVNMSDSIAKHEKQQQDLMDSFVELIAQAIDDKSPYTGGHCHRVPELGLMLAKQASKNSDPHFAGFSIEDRERHREFWMAAWLHDCGKITTPEHVVDKGSKLETSYNRIHEIRTRFEVLWRDAEIGYWKGVSENPQREAELKQQMEQMQQTLLEEFEFVAQQNVGCEYMQDSYVEKLRHIAARTWVRHFDDCLGLSPAEEKRLKQKPAELPVIETLISDKPAHKIRWERKPDYDETLGIKLVPPQLQNNQGELYNLMVRKGTLNSEERFRIQEHTVSTIKILEGLPFPKELENVPRYASTHHENLKGTGYPRNIPGEELSIGERILVLADIFEALTADDRPYKEAKTLSTAIDILFEFVEMQHIDPEIFRLFLVSGVYKEYANRYLTEAQMDEVDIDKQLEKLDKFQNGIEKVSEIKQAV